MYTGNGVRMSLLKTYKPLFSKITNIIILSNLIVYI